MHTNRSLKNILSLFLLLLCTHILSASSVVINEVQYKNISTLKSSNGAYYDWVELYNTTDESIDLSGYYLKDGYNDSDSLSFSDCSIAPKSYLLVFCSDKRLSIADEWHAPFKLAVMQDTVYLFSDKHNLVDSAIPRCVPPDCTLARWPDGQDFKVCTPSPQSSNTTADTLTINYVSDTLSINLPSGFYTEDIHLELHHTHPENEIRYTLDGETVDWEATRYGGPISLSALSSAKNRFANYDKDIANPGRDIPKAHILRAQVFSCGCPASKEISNTYFIGDKSFTQNIPLVSIITDPDNLFDKEEGIYRHPNYLERGKKWEREAQIEIFDSALHMIIEQDAGLRIHGAGSRRSPQKSFRLYAREEYGDTTFAYPFFSQKKEIKEYPHLLLKSLRDWTATLFKAEMCQYLVDDLDFDYSASETVIVLIDGEYWGAYNLREYISDSYIPNNYPVASDAFDLIKYTRTDSAEFDAYNTCDQDVFGGVSLENGSIDAYYDFVEYLYYAQPKSPSFYEEVSQKIDVPSFIDYLIAELYLANADFIDNNIFFWKTRDDAGKWRPIFYDLDGSMHSIRHNYLSELMTAVEGDKSKPFWSTLVFSTLLQNDEFCQHFSSRYYELLRTTFSSAEVIKHIDAFYKTYQAIIPLHLYRWSNPTDITKWHKNVETLYEFAIQRPVEVFKQLNRPVFTPFQFYPNPVKDRLNLTCYREVKTLALRIYSLTGQEMLRANYESVNTLSQALALDDGLYLLYLNIDGFSYTEKIIVKH